MLSLPVIFREQFCLNILLSTYKMIFTNYSTFVFWINLDIAVNLIKKISNSKIFFKKCWILYNFTVDLKIDNEVGKD